MEEINISNLKETNIQYKDNHIHYIDLNTNLIYKLDINSNELKIVDNELDRNIILSNEHGSNEKLKEVPLKLKNRNKLYYDSLTNKVYYDNKDCICLETNTNYISTVLAYIESIKYNQSIH